MDMVSGYTQIAIGVALLLLGRKLFWFFIGALGFVLGLEYAAVLFPAGSVTLQYIGAACLGVVAALMAVFLTRLAIVAGGFLSGGYLALQMIVSNGASTSPLPVIFLIGGAIGALAMFLFFDWALIGLSSLFGAALVINNISLPSSAEYLMLVAMVSAGFILQTWMSRHHEGARHD